MLWAGQVAVAQSSFSGGIGFTVGLPQTEFKENVTNTGFGGGGYVGYHLPQMPFMVGGRFDYVQYGSETRNEPFSPSIPDVRVDVTTTNSILQGHLLLRIQPQDGSLRPYLDGMFGFNYLATRTAIKSERFSDEDDEVASSTNYEDTAMSYGGGGGLMIAVYQGTIEQTRPFTILVDLGVRYLNGGKAAYLKEGDIERFPNGKVVYNPSTSTTDLLTFNIGASINF